MSQEILFAVIYELTLAVRHSTLFSVSCCPFRIKMKYQSINLLLLFSIGILFSTISVDVDGVVSMMNNYF